MKQSTTLYLPLLLLALASCGTSAQYSQQWFQDGIYARPGAEPRSVRLYSEEDFKAMAAENIARKQQKERDTVYVVVNDGRDDAGWLFYDAFSPWAWSGVGFGLHYYWDRWRFGWYDPWWYGPWHYDPWFSRPWYGGWYDPWFSGWFDPWYFDPWRPHYWYGHPHHPGGILGGGPRPGGPRVYTPRSRTQPGPPRVQQHPGGGIPGAAGYSCARVLLAQRSHQR